MDDDVIAATPIHTYQGILEAGRGAKTAGRLAAVDMPDDK
jgi:hypothetical protein